MTSFLIISKDFSDDMAVAFDVVGGGYEDIVHVDQEFSGVFVLKVLRNTLESLRLVRRLLVRFVTQSSLPLVRTVLMVL